MLKAGYFISHYFTEKQENLPKRDKKISLTIMNKTFYFNTDSGVFSRNAIDFGSRLLLEELLKIKEAKKVLEIGCGYGGIVIPYAFFNDSAAFMAVDINERAVDLAKINLLENKIKNIEIKKSDIYKNIIGSFDLIFSNPPIRAGKKVTYAIYEQAFLFLENQGRLIIVIQKKQGAPSTMEKLKEVFGNVEILCQKKGYYVLEAKKETLS